MLDNNAHDSFLRLSARSFILLVIYLDSISFSNSTISNNNVEKYNFFAEIFALSKIFKL